MRVTAKREFGGMEVAEAFENNLRDQSNISFLEYGWIRHQLVYEIPLRLSFKYTLLLIINILVYFFFLLFCNYKYNNNNNNNNNNNK